MQTLIEYLTERNEKTLAWVAEDPKNRWASTFVVDEEFWAKDGITTVAEFIHFELVSSVYETTRDVWGFKPSWSSLMSMTDEELQIELNSLCETARKNLEYEQLNEAYEAELKKEEAFVNPYDLFINPEEQIRDEQMDDLEMRLSKNFFK